MRSLAARIDTRLTAALVGRNLLFESGCLHLLVSVSRGGLDNPGRENEGHTADPADERNDFARTRRNSNYGIAAFVPRPCFGTHDPGPTKTEVVGTVFYTLSVYSRARGLVVLPSEARVVLFEHLLKELVERLATTLCPCQV